MASIPGGFSNRWDKARYDPGKKLSVIPKTIQRVFDIPTKVRNRGWKWALRRMHQNLVGRRTLLPRLIRGLLFKMVPRSKSPASDNILYCIYDLEYCPVTFDIVSTLIDCEFERKQRGCSATHLVLVPGHNEGLRVEIPEYEEAVPRDDRRMRISGILLPAVELAPGCGGYSCLGTRHEVTKFLSDKAEIYPRDYSLLTPAAINNSVQGRYRDAQIDTWPTLEAGTRERAMVADYLTRVAGERRTIVISLRDMSYMPARNSNVEAWSVFAARATERGFCPIFVPDTDSALEAAPQALEGFDVCRVASSNLGIRMALYELAWLNMASAQGPLELCWYNRRCRYISFLEVGAAPQCTPEMLARSGLKVGEQPAFVNPAQMWVWEADDLATIESAFCAMETLLERVEIET